MWNLINNNLKIFIDPFIFMDLKNLDEEIKLTGILHYLKQTEPSLCAITFFFPKFAEKEYNIKKTWFSEEENISFIKQPPSHTLDIIQGNIPIELSKLDKAEEMLNKFFTLAIENKCLYYLTEINFTDKYKMELEEVYRIKIVGLKEIYANIEAFLQGFYNYFKFRMPVYGVKAPDIAHAMSDNFYINILTHFETEISKNQPSNETIERVRSFVHNRYLDILITIDKINFFKQQRYIFNIESKNYNTSDFYGYIRYYINYYLFLLWGAIDHLAWIINDILSFGYSPEINRDRHAVGLHSTKKEFLDKIKNINENLYNYIISADFQDWLDIFSKLRHKNAHREMFSAGPLFIETDESKISDEEIDKIIYKDSPPVPKEIEDMFFPEFIENRKIIDRLKYKISKMEKGIEHCASIEKDGKKFIFDPVSRIPLDLQNLQDLIKKSSDAYDMVLQTRIK